MNWIQCFVKAIFGGMLIGIGGIVFLSSDIKIVGAVLFSVGLFTILSFGFNLYTGKVCYVFNNDKEYFLGVLVTIAGNFVGCLIMGLLFPMDAAVASCTTKLTLEPIEIVAKAFGCGILMFVAVELFKEKGLYLATFICVPTFIMAGFEHSIADMFYFCSAGIFDLSSLTFILIALFGNAIGCFLFPAYKKYIEKQDCTCVQ